MLIFSRISGSILMKFSRLPQPVGLFTFMFNLFARLIFKVEDYIFVIL